MTKLLEIQFYNTYKTKVIEEKQLDMYDKMENFCRAIVVENCQTCGDKTTKLEVVGSLARCKDCEKSFTELQERANYYQSLPYNSFDNDFED